MPWGIMDESQAGELSASQSRAVADAAASSQAIQADITARNQTPTSQAPYSMARQMRSGVQNFGQKLTGAMQKTADQKTLKAPLPMSGRTPDFSLSPMMKPGQS